jgi:hypothetical protein
MISCKMIKHSCKWEIVACNCELNGYIIKRISNDILGKKGKMIFIKSWWDISLFKIPSQLNKRLF